MASEEEAPVEAGGEEEGVEQEEEYVPVLEQKIRLR